MVIDDETKKAELASWDDVVWWLREHGLSEKEIAEIEKKLREKKE